MPVKPIQPVIKGTVTLDCPFPASLTDAEAAAIHGAVKAAWYRGVADANAAIKAAVAGELRPAVQKSVIRDAAGRITSLLEEQIWVKEEGA